MLEMQSAPGSPRAAAARFAQSNGLSLQNTSEEDVGGMDAFHALALANSQSGPLVVDLTWIAHPQAVLRVTGVTPQSRYRANSAALSGVARSLRRLSAAERGTESRRSAWPWSRRARARRSRRSRRAPATCGAWTRLRSPTVSRASRGSTEDRS